MSQDPRSVVETLRRMQFERARGALMALFVSFNNQAEDKEAVQEISEIIGDCIKRLERLIYPADEPPPRKFDA